MNARPQMTIAEPRIRMPAWRSVSPAKRSVLPPNTSPITRPLNFAMSPSDASQSRGTSSQDEPIT